MSALCVYFLLRRRMDSGRIKILSTNQQASSPTPSLVKIKLHEVKSLGPGPMRNLAVKKPFFPSKEYFPLSIIYDVRANIDSRQ
jgi:hypothetical protein